MPLTLAFSSPKRGEGGEKREPYIARALDFIWKAGKGPSKTSMYQGGEGGKKTPPFQRVYHESLRLY